MKCPAYLIFDLTHFNGTNLYENLLFLLLCNTEYKYLSRQRNKIFNVILVFIVFTKSEAFRTFSMGKVVSVKQCN